MYPFRQVFIVSIFVFDVGSVAAGQQAYEKWQELKNPFPSTGGGWMIDGYKPVVSDGKCRTDFQAIEPGTGKRLDNTVEFDAVSVQGGILCTKGKWRSKDGSMSGTTPFQVFIKDGIVRRPPA